MPEQIALRARHPRGLSTGPLKALQQYHAWPDRFDEMARRVSNHYRAGEPPAIGRYAEAEGGSLLRTHPQRLWFVSDRNATSELELPVDIGVSLDLSHARVLIQAEFDLAEPLLSRFVSVDLRLRYFPIGSVALAPLHRVSVLLQRRTGGIDIFAPRSFSASLWDVLVETAERL